MIYCSPFTAELVNDSGQVIGSALVAQGDNLVGQLSFDGGQAIDLQEGFRWQSARAVVRDNAKHVLRFEVLTETSGIDHALAGMLSQASNIQRQSGDVRITVHSMTNVGGVDGVYLFKHAAIESWAGSVDEHLRTQVYSIQSGQLIEVTNLV